MKKYRTESNSAPHKQSQAALFGFFLFFLPKEERESNACSLSKAATSHVSPQHRQHGEIDLGLFESCKIAKHVASIPRCYSIPLVKDIWLILRSPDSVETSKQTVLLSMIQLGLGCMFQMIHVATCNTCNNMVEHHQKPRPSPFDPGSGEV